MSVITIPAYASPFTGPNPLLMKDAKGVLTSPYLPMEAGYALNSEEVYHVAGHTYMKDVTGWFGVRLILFKHPVSLFNGRAASYYPFIASPTF